jgi:hypothetical protein
VPPATDAQAAGRISCAYGGQFPNMRGSLIFDGCRIDNVDDDGVAIMTPYIRVLAQPDPHTLQLQRNPGIEAGDMLALLDWTRKSERLQAKVISIAAKSDQSCVVTIDRDVQILHAGAGDGKSSGTEARGDGIDRAIDYTLACQSVLFRNCRMQSQRGRAINLKAQNCVIEGCTFTGCELPAIAAGPEFYWEEGPSIRNLTIRNNHFVNCNTNNIDIGAFEAGNDCNAADNRTIAIEGNRFEGYGAHASTHRGIAGCAIHIGNADSVLIRNNIFGAAGSGAAKDAGKVIIEKSRNVTVGKNDGLAEGAVQRK